MLIYLITILLLSLLSIYDILIRFDNTSKKLVYWGAYIFIVLQVGLRWETGTDWEAYLSNFNLTDSTEIVLINALTGFELGYGLFTLFIKTITNNYTIFLLIISIIYNYLFFDFNFRFSPFPFLSLLLIYTSTMGVLGSHRQLIALGLCLFSLKYLISGRNIIFFLFVIVAFLFHSSSILFCIYYFLNRNFNKYVIIFSLLLAFVLGKSSLPNYIFNSVGTIIGGASRDKAEFYINATSGTSLSFIGLLRRIIYFFLFFYFYSPLKNKIANFHLLFNGFVFGLIFYFLFSNSLLILVSRGSLYFNIMENILLASLIILFGLKKDKIILVFVFTIYSYFSFHQSISIYPDLFLPYKGIFLNSDFKREMH